MPYCAAMYSRASPSATWCTTNCTPVLPKGVSRAGPGVAAGGVGVMPSVGRGVRLGCGLGMGVAVPVGVAVGGLSPPAMVATGWGPRLSASIPNTASTPSASTTTAISPMRCQLRGVCVVSVPRSLGGRVPCQPWRKPGQPR